MSSKNITTDQIYEAMGTKKKKTVKTPKEQTFTVRSPKRKSEQIEFTSFEPVLPTSDTQSDVTNSVKNDIDSLICDLNLLPDDQLMPVVGIIMGRLSKLMIKRNTPVNSSPKILFQDT